MAKAKPTEQALEVLKQCTIEGNIVKLPDEQLDRNLYVEVKKHLELIGGKWKGGKTQGFVFETDPTELLAAQANGDGRDLKQEFQFFPTPSGLAVRMAGAISYTPGMKILEPSAGRGALVQAVREIHGEDIMVDCFELMEINRVYLSKVPGANIIGEDFLKSTIMEEYDAIIANPPFTGNQDIEHIYCMWDALKPGGQLVVLASQSWTFGSQKKQVAFREWLDAIGAFQEEIDHGIFKESGTNVSVMLLVMEKASVTKVADTEVARLEVNTPAYQTHMVRIEDIIPDPNQPRKFYRQEDIDDLANSFVKHGVLQAITIRPKDDGFYIVFGERRYRAAKQAGLLEIPATVRAMDDTEALEVQVIENLQRKDVHPMEEAGALKQLSATIDIKEIANRIGKSERYVAVRIKLMDLLPEFQEMYFMDRMSFEDAKLLSKQNVETQQMVFDDQVGKKDWRKNNVTLGNIAWQLRRANADLKEASFSLKDAKLYPEMGACTGCTYNSKNNLALFEEKEHKCYNPSCYELKTHRSFDLKLDKVIETQPDILFVYRDYCLGDEEKAVIKRLSERDINVLAREEYTMVAHPGDKPDWEEKQKTEAWWRNDPDETDEDENQMREDDMKSEYDEDVQEWESEMAEYEAAIQGDKVRKAFIVVGHDAGKIIDIIPTEKGKAVAEGASASSVEEIDKIEKREIRAKELDGEKLHANIKNAFKGYAPFLDSTAELSKNEWAALAVFVAEHTGYETRKWAGKEVQASENAYGYVDNLSFYQKVQSMDSETATAFIAKLIRRTFIDKLMGNGDNPSKSGPAAAIRQLAMDYIPEQVKQFDIEQEEKSIKRQERVNKRIEELKKATADEIR